MPGYTNAAKVLTSKVKFKDMDELNDDNLVKMRNADNRKNYVPIRPEESYAIQNYKRSRSKSTYNNKQPIK